MCDYKVLLFSYASNTNYSLTNFIISVNHEKSIANTKYAFNMY